MESPNKMSIDLRNMERRCHGTGELECHCGGDLCVCGTYELTCPGCPDCRDSNCWDDDYPDEPEDKYDEADRRCEKQGPGQCNLVGSTYCDFYCPYRKTL